MKMKKILLLPLILLLTLSFFPTAPALAWDYTCRMSDAVITYNGYRLSLTIADMPNGTDFVFEFTMQTTKSSGKKVNFSTKPYSVSGEKYVFELPSQVRETFTRGNELVFTFRAIDEAYGNTYTPESPLYCMYNTGSVTTTNPITDPITDPMQSENPKYHEAGESFSLLPLGIVIACLAPVTVGVFIYLEKKH